MQPARVSRADETAEAPAPADAEAPVALFAPSLFAGLDTDDSHTVHTAGYGLYVLASAAETGVAAIACELVARLTGDDDRTDVLRTLASLRTVDDEAVRTALLSATTHDRARELYTAICETEPWNPPRPLSADGGDHTEYLTAFRQVIDPTDPETVERSDERGDDPTDVEVRAHDQSATEDTASDDGDDTGGEQVGASAPASTVQTKRDRIEQVAESETFRTIAHRSGFDELDVVSPETERRYANVVRARARADGTERGVAIRLLQTPDGRLDALTEHLRSWAQLVAAAGVVTVVDWGTTPQPWVATEYVEETLARHGRLEPATALRQARALTGALVQLHQQDVTHGAIDPRNVAYAADTLSDARPMLDNAGLVHVYRQAFDPADYLDPRYAAPEYFDDGFGRLDHATDIYQLGTVIYRLCTGRHPFDGSYDEIRTGVLKAQPPAVTECAPALPAAMDEVLAKATAKQKLTRYETANAFHQDVSRICAAVFE